MLETSQGIWLSKSSIKPEKVIPSEFEGQPIIELEGWASTEDIDRDGEVLKMDGWRKKSLQTAKFLLFHDYGEYPIGKLYNVRTKEEGSKKGLFFRGRMGPQWQGYETGMMYLNGDMDSFSVGFNWFSREVIEGADGIKKPFRIYTDLELYEISAVNVPANPNATLAAAIRTLRDIADEDDFKAILKDIWKQNQVVENLKEQGGYVIKCDYETLAKITQLQVEIAQIKKDYALLKQEYNASEFTGNDIEIDLDNEVEVDALDAEGDTLEVLVSVGDVQVDVEIDTVEVEI